MDFSKSHISAGHLKDSTTEPRFLSFYLESKVAGKRVLLSPRETCLDFFGRCWIHEETPVGCGLHRLAISRIIIFAHSCKVIKATSTVQVKAAAQCFQTLHLKDKGTSRSHFNSTPIQRC